LEREQIIEAGTERQMGPHGRGKEFGIREGMLEGARLIKEEGAQRGQTGWSQKGRSL
jgi:hypothetical protein